MVHLSELEGKLIVSDSMNWIIKTLFESATGEELTDEKLKDYQTYLCGLVNGIRYCMKMEPFKETSKFIDMGLFVNEMP